MKPEQISDCHTHNKTSDGFQKVITDRFEGVKKITPQLLASLRSGDTDAYKALYHITHRPLYAFISRAYPRFDAEEITQDVMIEVWEKRDRIDPERNFGGYMFRMAVSHANKIYHRSQVEKSYLNYAQNENQYTSAPDNLVIEEQTQLLYDIALSHMPERRRRIFEMYRDDGMTYEQIAYELGISRETVKYNVRIAKKELSELLMVFIALISISQ